MGQKKSKSTNQDQSSETTTDADSDIVSDDELQKESELWRKKTKGRPMRVLVCGLGGVGKSTLINNLLQLKGEDKLIAAKRGRATTTAICQCERETKSGIKVCLFDTPGLGDAQLSDKETIAMMISETNRQLDIAFYCIALDGSARVQHGDVLAIKIMTEAFTRKIWKRSVIVLTKANVLEKEEGVEYDEVIMNITESIQGVLKEADVHDEDIDTIPIVTAGHTADAVQEKCKNWEDQLFLAALKQVDPVMFPALFEARFSWKGMMSTIGATVGGVLVGAGIGAGTGAIFGEVAGPLGAVVGAGVGAVVGGTIGGIGGGLKMAAGTIPVEINPIVKIKFRKWKKRMSHQQAQN